MHGEPCEEHGATTTIAMPDIFRILVLDHRQQATTFQAALWTLKPRGDSGFRYRHPFMAALETTNRAGDMSFLLVLFELDNVSHMYQLFLNQDVNLWNIPPKSRSPLYVIRSSAWFAL